MTNTDTRVEHTSGPWTYAESCTHELPANAGWGSPCKEGCRVGGIWSPSRDAEGATFVTNPLWIRDRALIASAPDMLAELERLYAELGYVRTGEVIRRARGEE